MKEIPEDAEREERIIMEIVVDAYDEEERSLGWYYYLEQTLTFPFQAKCLHETEASPLEAGEKVTVTGMPSEEACENDMLVKIKFGKRSLAVPLSQLEAIDGDDETEQAIADWHYWIARRYEF